MRNWVSASLAGKLLLLSLALLSFFHLLVLFGLLPASIVWGGAASSGNLVVLEMIALGITLLFAWMVFAKLADLRAGKSRKLVNAGLWILIAYLAFNLIGNLASAVSVENLVFAPITLVMALLALRLALER